MEALLLPEVQLIQTLDPQEVPIVLPQVHNFFGRKFKMLVKLSVQKKDVKSLYLKKIHEFSIFFPGVPEQLQQQIQIRDLKSIPVSVSNTNDHILAKIQNTTTTSVMNVEENNGGLLNRSSPKQRKV